jgi:pimeloyl-[acyl-carrier protein] synthase
VPIEISGVTIKPGEQVAVLLGSINRDERIFEHSEEFDVARNPNRHLAFGYGSHNCLGQTLARIQAQSVLKSLLSFNSISLVNRTVSYKHNTFFRSLASLNVLFR